MNADAALKIASERALAWAQDHERDDRYPNRTHFVGVEHPEHDQWATEALLEGDPVVLIYPDGHELLINPQPGGGAHLETRDSSGRPIAA
ncbi:MAG TPA: hypothetical protein VIT89_05255 [Solirubrobacterales bacterium]